MSHDTMNLTLKIWRQAGPDAPGRFETYAANNISEHMSFLEMLDQINRELTLKGEEPIAFDSDCREGICGTCDIVIDGRAHGADHGGTVCQLHMRRFKDGDTITIEPWRATAFPIIKDLIVDRTAFDRIYTHGGYVSVNTGQAPEAASSLVPKDDYENAMDAAACIGCGACVAACPNGAAMLFVSARVSHLSLLPQGHPERARRVLHMVRQMDKEGFGNCTNIGECQAACPKEISVTNIARMNKEYLLASFCHAGEKERVGGGAG